MTSQVLSTRSGDNPHEKTPEIDPKPTRPPVNWSHGFLALPKHWIRNHWLAGDPVKWAAFIGLLLDAAHEPRTVRDGATPIFIPVGGSLWSVNRLALRWGWSRNKTAKFLDALETAGDIEVRHQKGSQQTIIICLDYSQLIEVPTTKGQRKDNERTTKGQRKDNERTTKNKENQEDQEDQETNPPPNLSKKASPLLPIDQRRTVWMTEDEIESRVSKWGTEWADAMTHELSNYAVNSPAKWAGYKDHAAVFDTWSRRNKKNHQVAIRDEQTGECMFATNYPSRNGGPSHV